MGQSIKEGKANLLDAWLSLSRTRVQSDGRLYPARARQRDMWWKPLHTPDGAPSGSASKKDGVKHKDVLVVEDEAYLCDLIADVLESEGHVTRTASNGREALELLRERRPHIILLDLMMPIMDCCEFLSVVKSRPELANIPFIIVTVVYDVPRTKQETGARAVITKPFDIDQLTEVVSLYAK